MVKKKPSNQLGFDLGLDPPKAPEPVPVEPEVDKSHAIFGHGFDWKAYGESAKEHMIYYSMSQLEELLESGRNAVKNNKYNEEMVNFFTTLNRAASDALAEKRRI